MAKAMRTKVMMMLNPAINFPIRYKGKKYSLSVIMRQELVLTGLVVTETHWPNNRFVHRYWIASWGAVYLEPAQVEAQRPSVALRPMKPWIYEPPSHFIARQQL